MTITPDQILQALPWLVVLVIFIGMALLQWGLFKGFTASLVQIIVLALRGGMPAPPAPPVPSPIPPPKPDLPPPPIQVPPVPAEKPPITPPPPVQPSLSRQAWPHDPAELDAFYGDPRGSGGNANPAWEAENLVNFTFPWKIKGGSGTYKIHKRVKPSLDRVLAAIWLHAGQSQAVIDAAHLNEFGGSYVYRPNRNNPAALSNHARGIALDLAPDENPNRQKWVEDGTHLPRWAIEKFKAEGWRWGGDYNSTPDAMHFEAVYDAHHDQQPVPAPGTTPTPTPPVVGSGTVTGKTSWFGGPEDTNGVSAKEGVAIYEPSEIGKAPPGLFLPEQPPGTTGLARRLNSDGAHYLAMRWDYKVTPRAWLQTARMTVTAPKTGKTFNDVIPADWGPGPQTGRVADLSHKLLLDLGIQTDDLVTVVVPTP